MTAHRDLSTRARPSSSNAWKVLPCCRQTATARARDLRAAGAAPVVGGSEAAAPRRARPLREGPDESHASLGRDLVRRSRRPPRAPQKREGKRDLEYDRHGVASPFLMKYIYILMLLCLAPLFSARAKQAIRTSTVATVADAPLATSGRRWACPCGRGGSPTGRSKLY